MRSLQSKVKLFRKVAKTKAGKYFIKRYVSVDTIARYAAPLISEKFNPVTVEVVASVLVDFEKDLGMTIGEYLLSDEVNEVLSEDDLEKFIFE